MLGGLTFVAVAAETDDPQREHLILVTDAGLGHLAPGTSLGSRSKSNNIVSLALVMF